LGAFSSVETTEGAAAITRDWKGKTSFNTSVAEPAGYGPCQRPSSCW